MYRVVDDDRAAGGVVGDIGGHLLASSRRGGPIHAGGGSDRDRAVVSERPQRLRDAIERVLDEDRELHERLAR